MKCQSKLNGKNVVVGSYPIPTNNKQRKTTNRHANINIIKHPQKKKEGDRKNLN